MMKKKRIPGHANGVASMETGQVGPSFEQAIQRLEQIVADMERAELPLEDVLKKYEEGTRLVRFCSQKLEEAEKKIELLTEKADGSATLKPFTGEEETGETENDRRRDTRATKDEDEAKLL
jgi:exodeoxyribonuclease VII small subunit